MSMAGKIPAGADQRRSTAPCPPPPSPATRSRSTTRASSPPDDWDEDLGAEFARLIGVDMTEEHWKASGSSARTTRPRARPRRCDGSARRRGCRSSSSSPVPEQAGQEDGLRRGRAQAERMRVMTTETARDRPEAPLVDAELRRRRRRGPQARHHLQQGHPRHGLPGPHPGQRRPGRGHRDPPVLHLLGLRHDQQEDAGQPQGDPARQHRHAPAAGSRRHPRE